MEAFLEDFLDFGFSDSESEPDPESDESFLAAFFGAGLSESESDPDEEDESFLAAFLAGAFLTGLSESEESEEESFLAAFLAGAFLAGFSESDESESEEEESSTLDFLTGTDAFSEVFLDLFLEADLSDLAETLDPALALLARTLAGFSSEELEEEELELDAFLLDFLSTFLVLVLSIDCFLDGASDEEAEAFLT